MIQGAELLADVVPAVRERALWCLAVAEYNGIPVTVTSGLRSMEKQAVLRQAWELGKSKRPANRPGDSAHNFGLAWDSWTPAQYMPVWIQIREYAGFRVADEQNDDVHAEVPDWRALVGLA